MIDKGRQICMVRDLFVVAAVVAAVITVAAAFAGIIIVDVAVPKERPDPPELLRVDRWLQQEVALQHIFIRFVGTADVASSIIISINGNLAALPEEQPIQPGRRRIRPGAICFSLCFIHVRSVRIR